MHTLLSLLFSLLLVGIASRGADLLPVPDKLVVLTFDDSVASHHSVARPVLKRYGFGATFFITEGFTFRTNKKDYMTWEQIAELHREGFEIGNHTRDHWGVTADTVGRLPEQLEAIAARCREHGIPAPVSFAWPGNAFHTNALPLLRAAGIRFARRGSEPEVPYKDGGGVAYEPGLDHPLLIPSAGDARPVWTLEDFKRSARRARPGRIAVIQFHGVPEGEHPWVHTPRERFEQYMAWLHEEGYQAIALRDLARYVDPDRVPADPVAIMERRKHAEPAVRDPSAWRTPPIRPQGFQFEIQISSLGTSYDPEKVRASIREHNLGEYESAVSKVIAAEWGYSFTHLDGQTDGAGRKIQAGYPTPPATRADCLPVIEAFLRRQYIAGADRPWASMNGHFPWHHYAAEFGFDQIGSEIGENINNYQWHIALNRGAARQYRRPWFIDFSAWHGPSITDYSKDRIWGEHSGPDHGHSISLFERSLFMSYMAGAGQITAEAGGAIAFLPTLDAEGRYRLSPYGEVCQRVRRFIRTHPDVGIPFTPVAVVLDFHHGAYPGFGRRRAFWHFDYNAGDTMTWDLIHQLWPGGWEVMEKKETGCLVNGPYGDVFDVLLQNAPQRVLDSYPCLILSGDLRLTAVEAARFVRYVHQGGTLLLNSAYLPQFPEWTRPPASTLSAGHDIPLGRGRVVVYGPDFQVSSLGPILQEELARLMPVSVSPGVQYLVNLRTGSVDVTLINNDGVTKEPRGKPVIDRSKDRDVHVRYRGERGVQGAWDLLNQRPLLLRNDHEVAVAVPAGEVRILEFRLD